MITCNRSWLRAVACGCLLLIPAGLISAERRATKENRKAPAAETVEMFAAIKAGQLEVRFIPKDETEARVMIKNKTQQPLSVKLPETFVGVPVLAQMRGGGGGMAGGGMGGGQQAMGGGMGGMGGGRGGGMGMMSVAPEKVTQFKVATVCLEHGKKEPRANIPYEIKALDAFSDKPDVRELMIAFGNHNLNQRVAQAAAWHLANGLTWEQLATKRIVHLNGTSEMWFDPAEIRDAMQLTEQVMVQVAQKSQASGSQTTSSSGASRNAQDQAN